jgi:hypothetical protein
LIFSYVYGKNYKVLVGFESSKKTYIIRIELSIQVKILSFLSLDMKNQITTGPPATKKKKFAFSMRNPRSKPYFAISWQKYCPPDSHHP